MAIVSNNTFKKIVIPAKPDLDLNLKPWYLVELLGLQQDVVCQKHIVLDSLYAVIQ